MPHPLVVHCKKDPYDVYIGRDSQHESPLGNKFSHEAGTLAEFQVKTREEAISSFEYYARMKTHNDPHFKKLIKSCYGRRLGCWCAPKPCHGEVIVKLAHELIGETPMRIIIAGSRDITDFELVCRAMRDSGMVAREVISGCASGVDTLGERWAQELNIPVHRYPADWDRHGKAAGRIRNAVMAENADALVAVTNGSPGTTNMIQIARGRKMPVYVLTVGYNRCDCQCHRNLSINRSYGGTYCRKCKDAHQGIAA